MRRHWLSGLWPFQEDEEWHRLISHRCVTACIKAYGKQYVMSLTCISQIGFSALRYTFEKLWVPLPGNKDRLNDEIKNLKLNDKRVAVVRKELSEEDRWKAELMDAFGGLCIAYSRGDVTIAGLGRSSRTGNAVSNDDLPELGRCGVHEFYVCMN